MILFRDLKNHVTSEKDFNSYYESELDKLADKLNVSQRPSSFIDSIVLDFLYKWMDERNSVNPKMKHGVNPENDYHRLLMGYYLDCMVGVITASQQMDVYCTDDLIGMLRANGFADIEPLLVDVMKDNLKREIVDFNSSHTISHHKEIKPLDETEMASNELHCYIPDEAVRELFINRIKGKSGAKIVHEVSALFKIREIDESFIHKPLWDVLRNLGYDCKTINSWNMTLNNDAQGRNRIVVNKIVGDYERAMNKKH